MKVNLPVAEGAGAIGRHDDAVVDLHRHNDRHSCPPSNIETVIQPIVHASARTARERAVSLQGPGKAGGRFKPPPAGRRRRWWSSWRPDLNGPRLQLIDNCPEELKAISGVVIEP